MASNSWLDLLPTLTLKILKRLVVQHALEIHRTRRAAADALGMTPLGLRNYLYRNGLKDRVEGDAYKDPFEGGHL